NLAGQLEQRIIRNRNHGSPLSVTTIVVELRRVAGLNQQGRQPAAVGPSAAQQAGRVESSGPISGVKGATSLHSPNSRVGRNAKGPAESRALRGKYRIRTCEG